MELEEDLQHLTEENLELQLKVKEIGERNRKLEMRVLELNVMVADLAKKDIRISDIKRQ